MSSAPTTAESHPETSLPTVPENTTEAATAAVSIPSGDNPLLDFWELPPFAAMTPEAARTALRTRLAQAQAAVVSAQAAVRRALEILPAEEATATAGDTSDAPQTPTPEQPLTWRGWYEPLAEALTRLYEVWGLIAHYHSVLDTPEWRAVYQELLPEITRFGSLTAQDETLYAGLKHLAQTLPDSERTAERLRVLELELRDRRLAGAELPPAHKPRYLEIQEQLSALSAKFSENVLDATNAFAEYAPEESALAGLPEHALQLARALAEKDGKRGFKLTLQMPSYLPVMQYAHDRALRARLYRAYATRASEFGPAALDNGPVIEQILALRHEEAQLLGFPHYAAYSLAPKMAESVEAVAAFLRELAHAAKPYAERDYEELQRFAWDTLRLRPLEPWDIAYASERLRQARYAYSEEEVRAYFPLPKVRSGLFALLERLYRVRFTPIDAPVWHEGVEAFALERYGETLGYLYFDPYARDSKKGGAWMNDARTRHRRSDGTLERPVVYLVMNFSPPVGNTPSTLMHDEVLTLFHEMGHGLHHLLTQVEERDIAGLNRVEWDAVELPSQHLEFFAWEWEVLQQISGHVDTGEGLPRALFDKMTAARFFQAGMQTVRQLEFALFDLRIHSELVPRAGRVPIEDVISVLDDVRREVAVVQPPAWHRFAHSFSHIFAGGYAAGYYSYKWAEVLAADAYAAFLEAARETGTVLDPVTGERYWREVLAVGSSRPASASFEAFRGRAPRIEPLLALTLGIGATEPQAA